MTRLRRWEGRADTIDLTVPTGRNLQSIRATNRHQTQRERRQAFRQWLREHVRVIRFFSL